MVALNQHNGDLDGHRIITKIMHGGSETPSSANRLCGMDTTPSTLDMYRSL